MTENARVDVFAAPGVHAAMAAVDAAAAQGLDARLAELVRLHASRINGCDFCTGLHTDAARAAGETEERLTALASGSPLFTPAERAALALTEAMTRLPPTGIPRALVATAREHFDETELAHLIWTIAAINTWNRVAVTA
ncbi:carboxymuconolactone decarboxylase family protein [Actinomadura atramentaria]|uniref:carboxymuconolactone decarboxylase family protein n=1 Tax=Actinomadura atramentaria TaxID=1990 RepID=UPI000381D8C1|nr:carboxymuconolactone decarboxylase family protein [Actinomadura atramentaria]